MLRHLAAPGAPAVEGRAEGGLPQGLLALPIAVAQAGLGPGLLTLLLVGALNTATAAWTARHTAEAYARSGAVPSLAALAGERLGGWGRLLATVGEDEG